MDSLLPSDLQKSFFDVFLNTLRISAIALVGGVLVWAVRTFVVTATKIRKMPPGPLGLPLLGNLFELPLVRPWYKLEEWKVQYGSLYTINMAGKPLLVVSSHKTAADLFDRRSSKYSDRPRFVMSGEIMTRGLFIALGNYYDPVWKKMRRAASENFSPRASEQYRPMQALEAGLTTLDIIAKPDTWEDCVARAMASNILTAVYGWSRMTDSPRDMEIVHRIHAHVERVSDAAIPGKYLVDIFPALRHLPAWAAKWKREGNEWHEGESALFAGFNRGVKERMDKGTSPACFVASVIGSQERHGLTTKEMDWLGGVMFAAGADTSFAQIKSFSLAMLLFPHVMQKAQAELDEVVGRDRIPTFTDRDRLPYTSAIVNEILRWRPAAPLSVIRETTEDDTYNGYFIPKGTVVVPNIWAMNHDPEIFSDPDVFRPERWLEKSLAERTDIPNLGSSWFGFGRRVCIGQYFADQGLFIIIATLLWALDFCKAADSAGRPITPDPDAVTDSGTVLCPAPFPCVMTPRFVEVKAVLERDLAAYST